VVTAVAAPILGTGLGAAVIPVSVTSPSGSRVSVGGSTAHPEAGRGSGAKSPGHAGPAPGTGTVGAPSLVAPGSGMFTGGG
jgi:hypothetical protein